MRNTDFGIDPVTDAHVPFRCENPDVQQVHAALRVDIAPPRRNILPVGGFGADGCAAFFGNAAGLLILLYRDI